jgi:hypothetical protein
MKIEININEYVECELTSHGLDLMNINGFKPDFIVGNWIRIQLWELMAQLGEHIFNGSEQSILDNKITLTSKPW